MVIFRSYVSLPEGIAGIWDPNPIHPIGEGVQHPHLTNERASLRFLSGVLKVHRVHKEKDPCHMSKGTSISQF